MRHDEFIVYLIEWLPDRFVAWLIHYEIAKECDNYYNPDSESGVLWSDLDLNIDWKINKNEIIVSEKDKNLPTFKEINNLF